MVKVLDGTHQIPVIRLGRDSLVFYPDAYTALVSDADKEKWSKMNFQRVDVDDATQLKIAAIYEFRGINVADDSVLVLFTDFLAEKMGATVNVEVRNQKSLF